jgi:hypothetical protein
MARPCTMSSFVAAVLQLQFNARLTLAHSGATVQLSDSTLQLGKVYTFDPGADFILVASSVTTGAEIERWERLAARLGTRTSVWNVSLYGGVDLLYVRRDGGSLIDELQGRVMVILNTRYALDASRFKQIAQDDLLIEEIYDGEC